MGEHGHVATYKAGCRCQRCALAAHLALGRQGRAHARMNDATTGGGGPVRDLIPTPVWHHQAACGPDDTHLFFSAYPSDWPHAKAICRMCPVRHECLEHSIATNEPHGVWGGLDERQRAQVVINRRTAS